MAALTGYDTETARRAIAGLSNDMPVASRKVADAVERARQQNLARLTGGAYKASTPGAPSPVSSGAVSAAGAGVTQASGQQQVQAAQTQAGQSAAVGNLALQAMGRDAQNAASEAGMGVQAAQREAEDRLADMSIGLKRQLVDDRLAFGRDENGRMILNTEQMGDLAIAKAKDETDLARYKQIMDQATRKHISVLKTMLASFQDTLKNKTSKEIQDLEQATKIDLHKASQDLKEQIAARETELANRTMQYGAVGGLVTGIVGGILGGPAGAAAGGSAGHAVGSGMAYA